MKNETFTTALQVLKNKLALGETTCKVYVEDSVSFEQVTFNIQDALDDFNNEEKGETHAVKDAHSVNLYIIEKEGDYIYSNSSMNNVYFDFDECVNFCTQQMFEDYFEEHDVECDWSVCKKEVLANSYYTIGE